MGDYIKFDGTGDSINAILEIFNLEDFNNPLGEKVDGSICICAGIRFKLGDLFQSSKEELLELELAIGDIVYKGKELILIEFADPLKKDLIIEPIN